MKRKDFFKKCAVISSVAIGVTVMFAMKNENKDNFDLSLRNVKMLQVSAGEAECVNESNNPCSVRLPNGAIIEGIGQPKATW
jgi:hypothetical protein